MVNVVVKTHGHCTTAHMDPRTLGHMDRGTHEP